MTKKIHWPKTAAKLALSFALAASLVPSSIQAQSQAMISQSVQSAALSSLMEAGSLDGLSYRIYVPQHEQGQKLPVVLYLHSESARGSDNASHIDSSLQSFFDASPLVQQAIVIAPQCPQNQKWVETDMSSGTYDSSAVTEGLLKQVADLVRQVQKQYDTDNDRVYAVGNSMGAFGVWDLLLRHDDLFAAGVAIGGGADVSQAGQYVDIPMWAAHGSADTEVSMQGVSTMARNIAAAGGKEMILKTLDGSGHDIWSTAAADAALDNWLFSKRLSDRTGGINLFNAQDADNWADAISAGGKKTAQAGQLATHKIFITQHDELCWNDTGLAGGLAELYDCDGHLVKTIERADVSSENGVLCYVVSDLSQAAGGYVRINIPADAADSLMVFRNLKTDWPDAYQSWDNILYQRTLLANGDSISYGYNDDKIANKNDLTQAYAWAGRIGDANSMSWQNVSRSAASVSTCRPANMIVDRFGDSRASGSFDYVLLQGGTNDGIDQIPAGSVSPDQWELSSFDRSTWAGALEYYFAYTISRYPGARIGYIMTYAQPVCNYPSAANPSPGVRDMSGFYEIARQACEKWNIPYLNLHDGTTEVNGELLSYSSDILKTQIGYGQDGSLLDSANCHINAQGYDLISPYIAAWAASLPKYAPAKDEQPTELVLEGSGKWFSNELSWSGANGWDVEIWRSSSLHSTYEKIGTSNTGSFSDELSSSSVLKPDYAYKLVWRAGQVLESEPVVLSSGIASSAAWKLFSGAERDFDGNRAVDLVQDETDGATLASLSEGTYVLRFKTQSSADAILFGVTSPNAQMNSVPTTATGTDGAAVIGLRGASGWRAQFGNDTGFGRSEAYNDGNWHTLAISVKNGSCRIAVDGEQKYAWLPGGAGASTFKGFLDRYPQLNHVWIGGVQNGESVSCGFNGQIAWAALSPEFFDQDQIEALTAQYEDAGADKTALLALLQQAKEAYENPDAYEKTSRDAFVSACENAMAIAMNEGATQTQVNEAAAALQTAWNGLRVLDFELLDLLAQTISSCQADAYADSLDALKQSAEEAAALHGQAESQNDIDQCRSGLHASYLSLRLKAAASRLTALGA